MEALLSSWEALAAWQALASWEALTGWVALVGWEALAGWETWLDGSRAWLALRGMDRQTYRRMDEWKISPIYRTLSLLELLPKKSIWGLEDLSASQPGLPFSQPGLLTLSPIRVAAPLQFKYKQKIV